LTGFWVICPSGRSVESVQEILVRAQQETQTFGESRAEDKGRVRSRYIERSLNLPFDQSHTSALPRPPAQLEWGLAAFDSSESNSN
jgi:hypothetical protein